MSPEITMREFRAGDEDAFWRLNEEWITRYFELQPAIRLYEPVGFRQIPAERVMPSSLCSRDVYMEMSL